jgi:hypothetical protein
MHISYRSIVTKNIRNVHQNGIYSESLFGRVLVLFKVTNWKVRERVPWINCFSSHLGQEIYTVIPYIYFLQKVKKLLQKRSANVCTCIYLLQEREIREITDANKAVCAGIPMRNSTQTTSFLACYQRMTIYREANERPLCGANINQTVISRNGRQTAAEDPYDHSQIGKSVSTFTSLHQCFQIGGLQLI